MWARWPGQPDRKARGPATRPPPHRALPIPFHALPWPVGRPPRREVGLSGAAGGPGEGHIGAPGHTRGAGGRGTRGTRGRQAARILVTVPRSALRGGGDTPASRSSPSTRPSEPKLSLIPQGRERDPWGQPWGHRLPRDITTHRGPPPRRHRAEEWLPPATFEVISRHRPARCPQQHGRTIPPRGALPA